MDDHFWPAVYPGLVVGGLYGLAVGGVANAVVGAVGGLAAAAIAFFLLGPLLTEEGLLPLAGLLGLSLLGAFVTIRAAHMAVLGTSVGRKGRR